MATFSAMFVARAVLPMLGRAARTTNSPGCSPPVRLSRSRKWVGVASPYAARQTGVDAVEGLDEQILDVGHAIGSSPIVDGENLFLRVAEQFLRLVGRIPGIAENLGAGVDQFPHRGLVANDFRIVRRVVRIGDRLGHLAQIGRPADRLELAFLSLAARARA